MKYNTKITKIKLKKRIVKYTLTYPKKTMKLKKILPIIGIIILIYILFTIDKEVIISDFSSIQPIYLILSFLAVFPILIITNYEWQLILKKHKIRISYIDSFKNILIGSF